MKTKYLLPNACLIYGWFLFIVVLMFFSWGLFFEPITLPNLPISIPWPFEGSHFITEPKVENGRLYLDIADELLYLTIIAGLFMVAFSRQKVEDERIAQIRLEALQWGIYTNYFLLILCIVFVYGTKFLVVLAYNMFTPLFIFVLRFYWLLLIRPAIEAKRERRLS
jgi:hypothetical protein